MNLAQCDCGVMEKEMLAVVVCLKEFHSLSLKTDLTIVTDHENLNFSTLNTVCSLLAHAHGRIFSLL